MQKPQPNSPLNYVVFRRAENATVSNVTMRGRIFQSTPLISSPAKFYFFYAMINKVSRLGFLFPNHRPKSNTIQRCILFEALTVPKKDHRCKKSSQHLQQIKQVHRKKVCSEDLFRVKITCSTLEHCMSIAVKTKRTVRIIKSSSLSIYSTKIY